MSSFFSDFFHSAQLFYVPTMLQNISVVYPFSLLSSISLWLYYSLVMCLPIFGCLDYFQFWAATSKAMNIHVQVYVWTYAFISFG